MVSDLQARLNDETLQNAIRQYPEQVYPMVASTLFKTLKARREALPHAASGYAEVIRNR